MHMHHKVYLEVTVHMSFLMMSLTYPSYTTTHEGYYASGQRGNQVSLGHEAENIRRYGIIDALLRCFLTSWSIYLRDGPCYRCLRPPAFFCHPTLSTIPFLMEHDNQQWRDLLKDLGPVRRQWCSEHYLLKAESTISLLSHFFFILYLFISLSA